jgi:methyl-accepting chemotaxis protein
MNKEKVPRWYGRKVIVNPKMQSVFFYYAFSMGVVFFAFGAILTALVHRYVTVKAYGWAILNRSDYFLVICLGLTIALGIYFGFVLSSNVAGPIFRLLGEMTKLADSGKATKLKFRKDDHFHDVAEAFNRILDRFHASDDGGGGGMGENTKSESPSSLGRELKR